MTNVCLISNFIYQARVAYCCKKKKTTFRVFDQIIDAERNVELCRAISSESHVAHLNNRRRSCVKRPAEVA